MKKLILLTFSLFSLDAIAEEKKELALEQRLLELKEELDSQQDYQDYIKKYPEMKLNILKMIEEAKKQN